MVFMCSVAGCRGSLENAEPLSGDAEAWGRQIELDGTQTNELWELIRVLSQNADHRQVVEGVPPGLPVIYMQVNLRLASGKEEWIGVGYDELERLVAFTSGEAFIASESDHDAILGFLEGLGLEPPDQ